MHKSLSILSFAAALSLAGAGFAQDTAADGADAADSAPATDAAEQNTDTNAEATQTEGAADTATADGAADAAADGAATDRDAEAPAASGAFSTGTEVEGAAEGEGQPAEPAVYIKEKFGDWNLRCFRNAEGEDPCQLYQLLREEGGNPVAEFSIFRIEGQAPAVAGATAIVPLVTLLTEELKLSVDGNAAKSYPYRVCTEAGCVAQIGLTEQDVATFKRGKAAQIVLVPAQAPDQKIKIKVSLNGFTAGYDAVGAFVE
ncbi:invasion-associated locus B family protein [Pelagivirga sediminicola]|uniref:Invasion-associated locus B family protein n=1 Tax=Pelagivirga sediminicola TaxID=2170575 RepID=A0A2T7GAT0_9RHOB|nr:invasion associated locus B family protein [Pelagivirga sediminicola]PVA11521.1 invasion-associated locus B family protein [Pelagivirga sediminicola]